MSVGCLALVRGAEDEVGIAGMTLKHFFPRLARSMNQIKDPRNPKRIIYPQSHLLFNGILMFMMQLGSRRQFRHERDTEAFLHNLRQLDGHSRTDFVADPDTLAYYAERVDFTSIERFLTALSVRLIRRKALDPFRLLGFFLIAVDGSQICTFDHEPWEGCPHRELSNGATQYFSYVLDAKLVTPTGMALTLATEMLMSCQSLNSHRRSSGAPSRAMQKRRAAFAG
jgi:hypothetical protein